MKMTLIAAVLAPVIACHIAALTSAQAASPPISTECSTALGKPTVVEAYKFDAAAPDERVKEVTLGDVIELKVSELGEVVAKCTGQVLVLFLNGYSMTALKPGPLVIPSANALRFTLKFADDARTTWVPILGYPGFKPRSVLVSFGVEGQYPVMALSDKATLNLETIGNRWFALWGALFVAMVILFYWCVVHTNIIRDGSAAHDTAGIRRAYSLSKTQGAVWFFVIMAAYMLIGIVTGDFFDSINSTALILLGIGAGTVIGSAVIDASKDVQNVAETELKNAALTEEQKASLDKEQSDKLAEKVAATSDYRKITGQNEQFLTDILSDANGVSFHRFQMAAWTLLLAMVFIKGVYENLAMPTFNSTLMGLLGLSAGTYLGLKIPEATTPKKTGGA